LRFGLRSALLAEQHQAERQQRDGRNQQLFDLWHGNLHFQGTSCPPRGPHPARLGLSGWRQQVYNV